MDIIEIANIIKESGGRLYLVGGAVRDKILGKKVQDEDYCITGLSETEFVNLFPNAKIRGKSFAVFDMYKKEFALARKEKKVGLGHKEFEVITGKEITIEEDLARRDITINSIAEDVLTKEIIDPFDGRKDIENKTIRATSKAFSEDPLRVYRVARFAANLEFSVDKNTLKLMNTLKKELLNLSKERVFVELKKALQTDKPSIFFNVLRDANVLDVHFLELYDLIGALQPVKYHPEGDAYNHTMLTLDNSAKQTKSLEIRFAALVHDLGKGLTPKEMYPHHYAHDKTGPLPVRELCKRIGVPNTWRKCGVTAAKEHMIAGIFFKMTPAKQVSLIERVEKSVLGIQGLQVVVNADRIRSEEQEKPKQFAPIAKKCIKEINGDYIMEKYGIKDGLEIKSKLHEERVMWMKRNLEEKKTDVASENGSITLFVLIALLFFVIALMNVFFLTSSRVNSNLRDTKELKEIYEKSDEEIETIYNNYIEEKNEEEREKDI